LRQALELVRVAVERALRFAAEVPNAETGDAMTELKRHAASFDCASDLMAKLNVED
jgi:hypothetical protein